MTEKLAVSIAEAASISGIGRTSLYAAVARGDLSVRKVGRRSLILLADLQRWLEGLPPSGVSKVSLSGKPVAAKEAKWR